MDGLYSCLNYRDGPFRQKPFFCTRQILHVLPNLLHTRFGIIKEKVEACIFGYDYTKMLHKITWVLLIIGGLNWGLNIFGWEVGQFLGVTLANIVYALVALSALYQLFVPKKSSAPMMAQ